MPVYGLRPDDVVVDAAGNVQTGATLTLHATQADAEAAANPLATVTTSAGRWSADVSQAPVWVRTPNGAVYEIADFSAKADKTYVDTQLAAKVDTATASATYAQKWKPSTAYVAGQAVVNPSGDVVTAKADHTSGASFNAANWNLSPTYATVTAVAAKADAAPGVELRNWYAALGNRDNAPAKVVVIGDSVVEGAGASARPGNKRWIDALRNRLRARHGVTTGGAGYIPTYYAGGVITTAATLTGTTTQNSANGLGLRALILGASSTATWTVTGTAVDLLYLKSSSSRTFSYSVDGGAETTFDTNNGAVTDNGILRISLGASGSHTLKLTFLTGGPYVEGIHVYDGDESKGIHVYEAGHHGFETTEYAQYASGHGVRIGSLYPHLVVIALGENDFLHNKAIATMKTNFATIVNGIKANTTDPDPSFLFVANMAPTHASTPLAPWSDYVQGIKEAAAANGAAFLDMTQRMPAIAGDTLGLYADGYHPNDKGHGMFADPVTAALSPR